MTVVTDREIDDFVRSNSPTVRSEPDSIDLFLARLKKTKSGLAAKRRTEISQFNKDERNFTKQAFALPPRAIVTDFEALDFITSMDRVNSEVLTDFLEPENGETQDGFLERRLGFLNGIRSDMGLEVVDALPDELGVKSVRRAREAGLATRPRSFGDTTDALRAIAPMSSALVRSGLESVLPPFVADVAIGLGGNFPTAVRGVAGAVGSAANLVGADTIADFATDAASLAGAAGEAFGQPTTIPGQIASSAGSLATSIGAGALGGAVLGPFGAVAGGLGAAFGQTAGSVFADAQDRLLERGRTEAQSRSTAGVESLVTGAFTAITEAVPLGRFVSRLTPIPFRRAFLRAVESRGGAVAIDAAGESLQETADQLFQTAMRFLAEDDPSAFNDLTRELGIAALAGGVLGGGAGAITSAPRFRGAAIESLGRQAQTAQLTPTAQATANPTIEFPQGQTVPNASQPTVPPGFAAEGFVPEQGVNDLLRFVDEIAATDLTQEEIASILPDTTTSEEFDDFIARVEARRTEIPPTVAPQGLQASVRPSDQSAAPIATPASGIDGSAVPSPRPSTLPSVPALVSTTSAGLPPGAASDSEEVASQSPQDTATGSRRPLGRRVRANAAGAVPAAQTPPTASTAATAAQIDPETPRAPRAPVVAPDATAPDPTAIPIPLSPVAAGTGAAAPARTGAAAPARTGAAAPARTGAAKQARTGAAKQARKAKAPVSKLRRVTAGEIDDRIITAAKDHGFLESIDAFELRVQDDQGNPVPFSTRFGSKIPAELTEAIADSPHLLTLLKSNVRGGGGEDSLFSIGVDRFVKFLRELGSSDVQLAADSIRSDVQLAADSIRGADPQIDLLIRAREVRDKGERLSLIPSSRLKPGDSFQIGHETFTVVDGPNGLRILDTGSRAIEIGPDGSFVDDVPIRAGSLVEGGEAAATEALAAFDERNGESSESADDVFAGINQRSAGLEERLRSEVSRLRKRARTRTVPSPDPTIPGARPGATILFSNLTDTVVAEILEIIADGLALTKAALNSRLTKIIVGDPKTLRQAQRIGDRIIRRAARENGSADGSELRKAIAAENRTARISDLRSKIRGQSKIITRDSKIITRDARVFAAQRLADAARLAKAQASESVRAGLRNEIVNILKGTGTRTNPKGNVVTESVIPLRVRGKLIGAAANARTTLDLARVINQARRELALDRVRSDFSRIKRRTSRKKLLKLTEERRTELKRIREEAVSVARNLREKLVRVKGETVDDFAERRTNRAIESQMKLTELANRAGAILQEHANELRVFLEGRAAQVAALIERAVTTIDSSARKPLRIVNERGEPISPNSPAFTALIPVITPESLAMTLDGDFDLEGDGGVFRMLMVNPIRRASDRRSLGKEEIALALNKIAADNGFGSLAEAMVRIAGTMGESSREFVEMNVGGAKRVPLSWAMHLFGMDLETRSRFVENGQKAAFDNGTNRKFPITLAVFDAVEEALTKNQKDFVEGVKGLIESRRAALFDAFTRLKGFTPEVVFGYFPIRLNLKAESRAPTDLKGLIGKWLENADFLRARVGPSNSAILIGDFLSIAIDHLETSNDIIHLAEPVRAASTVLLDNRVRSAVESKYGVAAVSRIEDIILAVSGLKDNFDSKSARIINRIADNTVGALVRLNPFTHVRQLAGIAALQSVMPARVFTDGLKGVTNDGVIERMLRSGFFLERYSEPVSARFTDSRPESAIIGVSGARTILNAGLRSMADLDVFQALATIPRLTQLVRTINAADRLPARIAWAGRENQVEREHPEWTDKQKFDWVSEKASVDIRRSQNTSVMVEASGLSSYARAHPWMKIFTVFTNDRNKLWNINYQAVNGGGTGKTRAAVATAASAAWGALTRPTVQLGIAGAVAAVTKLLGGEPPEGGEEKEREQLLDNAAWQFASDVFGSTIPFSSRVVQTVQSLVQGRGPRTSPLFDGPQLAVVKEVSGFTEDIWAGFKAIFSPLEDFAEGRETPANKADRNKDAARKRFDRATGKFLGALENAVVGVDLASNTGLVPLFRIFKREINRLTNIPTASQVSDAVEAGDEEKAVRLAVRFIRADGEEGPNRTRKAASLKASLSGSASDDLSDKRKFQRRRQFDRIVARALREGAGSEVVERTP